MTVKGIILTAAALVSMLIIFQSCYDATTLTINNAKAIDREVSFKADILPLFGTYCSLSGCHINNGKLPDLTPYKAYNSLIQGNYVNVTAPDQSKLYLWLIGKKTPQMPLDGPYDPLQLNELVLAWITQGAKNN